MELGIAGKIARSYASEGLLVDAVSPAFIHTPATDAMMTKRADELDVSVDEAISSFLEEERPYTEFVNGSKYRVESG